jgi:hypothetical protein
LSGVEEISVRNAPYRRPKRVTAALGLWEKRPHEDHQFPSTVEKNSQIHVLNHYLSREFRGANWMKFFVLEKFAGDGFNKSQAEACAVIEYRMAYLTARFPVEVMAKLTSCDLGSVNKIVLCIAEATRMAIPISNPDMTESLNNFPRYVSENKG